MSSPHPSFTRCEYTIDDDPLISHGLLILSVLSAGGLALTIIGSIQMGNAKTQSALSTATALRHVGAVLIAILIVAIFILHVVCWTNRHRILKARRTVSVIVHLSVIPGLKLPLANGSFSQALALPSPSSPSARPTPSWGYGHRQGAASPPMEKSQ